MRWEEKGEARGRGYFHNYIFSHRVDIKINIFPANHLTPTKQILPLSLRNSPGAIYPTNNRSHNLFFSHQDLLLLERVDTQAIRVFCQITKTKPKLAKFEMTKRKVTTPILISLGETCDRIHICP